jgi:hypothetical protein
MLILQNAAVDWKARGLPKEVWEKLQSLKPFTLDLTADDQCHAFREDADMAGKLISTIAVDSHTNMGEILRDIAHHFVCHPN